jgi:UDP-glucose 4-epimerase
MSILITGGAGYIGSHTCVSLLTKGYTVIVADNLCNSKIETLDRVKQITHQELTFVKADMTDAKAVEDIFSSYSIEAVIHFAGLKAVGESVTQPLRYYYNNTVSTMVLVNACLEHHVNKFIFSSSATVYGDNQVPFVEDMKLNPTSNPYGETKVISERILSDIGVANPEMTIVHLRYFNPVGAHSSGLIGDSPLGIPNNLMPYITQVAKGKLKSLKVFGNDYPTKDGTGVRDYIHVVDLAEGHVAALEKLNQGVHIFNLGTGQGVSVLQLIQTFKAVNLVKIPFTIVERRPGDVASSYADSSKANRELGWKTVRGIEEMCRDAWHFEQTLK